MPINLDIHDGHCATVLMSDEDTGAILFCASEERFTRKKNIGGFPIHATREGLKAISADPEEVSKIRFSTTSVPEIEISVGGKPRFLSQLFSRFGTYIPREILISNIVSRFYLKIQTFKRKQSILSQLKLLNMENAKVFFYDHHECHAASCIPFLIKNDNLKDTLIFTFDGSGDAKSSSVSILEKGRIRKLTTNHTIDSIGEVYSQITASLRMKPLEHEFKVMGLAPYSNQKKAEEVADILEKQFIAIRINKKSRIPYIKSLTNAWGDKLKGKLIKSLGKYRFDEIAGGIQLHAEKLIVDFIKGYVHIAHCKNLAFAGGVFMNIKLNQQIKSSLGKDFTYTTVPSCGDESLVFGSWAVGQLERCSYNSNQLLARNISDAFDPYKVGLYMGTAYENTSIEQILQERVEELENHNIKFKKVDNPEKLLATYLSNNKICARFSGRMEWGARSLGNRSILANPSEIFNLRKINKAIKCRDFWMPFAPSINEEYVTDYLDIPNHSLKDYYFMQVGADTLEKTRTSICCAIHQYDYTARPQIVVNKINPKYHLLIEEFKAMTGIGGILNTSFNLHGYPVVENPNQAIDVFIESGLEVLQLENYVLAKIAL